MNDTIKKIAIDEPDGFFICGHCKSLVPDELCIGVIQVDDDPTHAELWCEECWLQQANNINKHEKK